MNALQSILSVSFVPTGADDKSETGGSAGERGCRVKVVSRQLLRFKLTIAYENLHDDTEKEQAARAFLAMVGMHSLEAAWAYLFSTVQLVPFFVCKPAASSDGASAKPLAPRRGVTPPPAPPAQRLLASIGTNFVFGTPVFWSHHTYTCASSPIRRRDTVYSSLRSSSPMDGVPPASLPALVDLQTSMPYVSATASPSFANSGNAEQLSRGASSDGGALGVADGADVHCEVIGTAQTVSADASEPRVVPAAGGTAALPRLLESSFTVELALPDLEAAALRAMDTTLAVVVLLPLSAGGSRLGVPVDPNQPSILRSVLARSLGQTHVETAAAAALVLGSGVVPVDFTEPFLCLSSTSPLSNDRLVLNLSLTNVTASAARLHSTSLDLHSSCVAHDAGGGGRAGSPGGPAESHFTASPLWGELRPGANLSSMRTIDLLTKLVTVTPVVVGEERPPFILHPGETYSFQFVIEVLPQLCYLLNSQSLEYVYERYYAVPQGTTSRPRRDAGESSGGGVGVPGASSRGAAAMVFSNGSAVTDCYGEAVSASELRGLLSYAYVSHMFVYYDLVTDGEAAVADAAGTLRKESETARRPQLPGQAHGAGLYLRYPARWSFGA